MKIGVKGQPVPKINQDNWTLKQKLYQLGIERAIRFCHVNKLPIPKFEVADPEEWYWDACAYYRPQTIRLYLTKCATPATQNASRNWNWPGSTTDREPYGVVCHELGHHVDWLVGEQKGKYSSEYSAKVMAESGEKPITSYCPNPAEWFAEMFRLFVTNASLLLDLRPKTYQILIQHFKAVSHINWATELGPDVPERIFSNLLKKVG